MRSVRELDVRGKRVLLRVDFNVPLRDGAIADDSRIRAAIPTIEYLREQGAAVIACSHLGRPRGRREEALRLRPVAARLGELIGTAVETAPDCVGPMVEAQARALAPGQVLLLENLRFHPGEEANDAGFARGLAAAAEVFVNDAFGAAHRAHASTEGVARLLPAAAGLLLAREVEALSSVLQPEAGVRAMISGGAKISDKIGLLRNLVQQVDILCLGGAMAHTFLLAGGVGVGSSLVERDRVDEARAIAAAAEVAKCRLMLPVDGVIAQSADAPPRARPVTFAEEPVVEGWSIFDIGPQTVEQFGAALREAAVVVWNGPLGLFERPAYSGGTRAVAELVAALPARTVVCGGETAQAVREAGVADRIGHVSTGGGAALELLEGRTLPGLAALPERD